MIATWRSWSHLVFCLSQRLLDKLLRPSRKGRERGTVPPCQQVYSFAMGLGRR
jgi:hypothetical protein